MYHVLIPMPVIVQLIMENTELAMFFHQTVVERLGYLRRKNSQPDPETHSRTFGRIIAFPERYLRCGRRPVYSEHLSLQRRPGQPLQHDRTSNAIRTLSNFAAEKLIIIDGRKIKLIDEERLKKISKIG